MDGEGDDSHGRARARPWVVIGLVLALGATTALVFTDDLRWLRLGIVAALWAALIGAFLATRSFKHARANEQAVLDAQAVYELELEREIAARREHELQTESEIRQRVDTEAREELESLRAELTALRESLQRLFGGEVLYERVALTAQSTRMRQLGEEEPQVVSAAPANGSAAAPGRNVSQQRPVARALETDSAREQRERTDLLDAVPAQDEAAPQANTGRPGAGQEPVPAPGKIPRADPPTRQATATAGAGAVASRAAKAAHPTRAAATPQQAPADQRPPGHGTGERVQVPPKVPPMMQRPGAHPPTAQPPASQPPAAQRPAAQPPVAQPLRGERPDQRPEPPSEQARPEQARPEQARPEPARQEPQRPDSQRPDPQRLASRPQQAESGRPQQPDAPRPPEYGESADDAAGPNPTLPVSAQAIQRAGRQSGRRRRADEEVGEPSADQPPAAETAEHEPAATDEQESGSHAQGRSVSDLLAAYGTSTTSGSSRRRRAQD